MHINGLCSENNKVWFVAREMAALIEVDLDAKSIQIIERFTGYALYEQDIVAGIVKKGNKLIMSPMQGIYIYIYDLDSARLHSIPIAEYTSGERRKFSKPILRGNMVWLVGREENRILSLDLLDYSVQEKTCEGFSKEWHTYWFLESDDNSVCINGDNKVIIKDLSTDIENVINISFKMKCMGGCRINGQSLFIGYNSVYFLENNHIKKIELPTNLKMANTLFSSVECVMNGVLLFPYKSNCILKYDCSTKKLMPIKMIENRANEICYSATCKDESGKIVAFNEMNNCLEIFDESSEIISSMYLRNPENIVEMLNFEKDTSTIFKEGEFGVMNLHEYIDCILQ